MRTTHDNVEIRLELLGEMINNITIEVNARNDMDINQIIDYGEKLEKLSLIQTALQIVYVKTDT